MRAITVRQPWAWAIVSGGKNVENRTWTPPRFLIGSWLAIHAGKEIDVAGIETLLCHREAGDYLPKAYVTGAVVGIARLVGVLDFSPDAPEVKDLSEIFPWYTGPVGWVLANVLRLVDPVPCKGAQGLWNLPGEILLQVAHGVPAAIRDQIRWTAR